MDQKLIFFGKCSLSLKTHFNAKMSEIFFKSLSENQKIQDGRHKNRNIAKNGTYVEKYDLMNMCMEFEPNRVGNEVRINYFQSL